MRDELSAIDHVRRLFAVGNDGGVGIGDDAAVLALGDAHAKHERLVWTVDEQVEGTHFRRDWCSWNDVGWRSFIAAASDVAAMGGAATHALVALALPRDFRDEDFEALVEGQRAAATAVGARVVGGNMARAPSVHVTTTVLGRAARPILRSGACAGDHVLVAGALGLAACGLRSLDTKTSSPALDAAVAAWRRPVPRFDDARAMAPHASSGIDVSDGLARDAAHVAKESGVRLDLDEHALLEHAARHGVDRAAAALGASVLDVVLGGGEDYALLVTSDREIPGFFRIGSVVAGSGITVGGRAIEPRGFDHF